jgi:hypothetical protein
MTELQLFELLKERLMPDLEYSQHTMSRYDCYSLEYNADIELKCRRKHYDELVIEQIKWEALMLRSSLFETIPVYINYTPQGLYSFRLLELEVPKWELKMMPKTTDFSSRHFIPKPVAMLHISLAKDLSHIL